MLALARTDEERERWRLFDPSGAEVPDPYYGGEDGFALVREQVREAAEAQLAQDFLRIPYSTLAVNCRGM